MPPIAPRRRWREEKGAFPLFDRDAYLARPHIQALPPDIRDAIAAHGIRNALLTSIAPTGTISLFADNVSSGIEPVFAFSYSRKVLQPDGSKREETVEDYALRKFRVRFGADAALPDYFVTAQTITPSRSSGGAGRRPALHRLGDFQDHQCAARNFLCGFRGYLSRRL